jgi:hypothetical protein
MLHVHDLAVSETQSVGQLLLSHIRIVSRRADNRDDRTVPELWLVEGPRHGRLFPCARRLSDKLGCMAIFASGSWAGTTWVAPGASRSG